MHERTLQITKELLAHLGVVAESVETQTDALGTVIAVNTKEQDVLIGDRGETLLALNHLIKRIVEKEGTEENFSVDVNDYQKGRNDDLRARAKVFADRAKAFQLDVEMDPMSSYERMVVHASLAGDAEIKTESAGSGRDRRVVVKYVGRPEK